MAVGKVQIITSSQIVIAVGGRPSPAECPGYEHCITSDDIFMKETAPGKTCVIGAGYVALECAGFITNLKQGEVVVLVRSIPLRGFDRDCVDKVVGYMEAQGTKILQNTTPTRIEKLKNGRLLVHYSTDATDEFDTVIAAVGRKADTTKLGLESANIGYDPKTGKIPCCANEQTPACDNVFVIGDAKKDCPELTPVAILAGKLLARRLFASSTVLMDYDNIATTVFTPLEFGTVGLSEDVAIERYGADGIEVFISEFLPLEWTVLEKGEKLFCLAKLVVNKMDEKILGEK